MPIQDQLAYALGRNDQEPNRHLAMKIVDAGDRNQVIELVQFIESEPIKRAQMDAILAVAYVGERSPKMISGHVDFLIGKLNNTINRVVFGSMIALTHVAALQKEKLFDALPKIIDAMDSGTVVTRDYGFRIMVTLYTDEQLQNDVFVLILEQLMKAPSNQLGQYAERIIKVVNASHLHSLIETLEGRRADITNEHHVRRLNKNLKKLYKQL